MSGAKGQVIKMNIIKNKMQLNATTIKIIAIVLMVFDHIHQMWAFSGAPMWLNWLGRPVFPIFLFAMAESFHYTRNQEFHEKTFVCFMDYDYLQYSLTNSSSQ